MNASLLLLFLLLLQFECLFMRFHIHRAGKMNRVLKLLPRHEWNIPCWYICKCINEVDRFFLLSLGRNDLVLKMKLN